MWASAAIVSILLDVFKLVFLVVSTDHDGVGVETVSNIPSFSRFQSLG